MNMCIYKNNVPFQELLTEIKANLGTAHQGDHLSEKIEAQLTQLHQIETDPSYTLVSSKTTHVFLDNLL